MTVEIPLIPNTEPLMYIAGTFLFLHGKPHSIVLGNVIDPSDCMRRYTIAEIYFWDEGRQRDIDYNAVSMHTFEELNQLGYSATPSLPSTAC